MDKLLLESCEPGGDPEFCEFYAQLMRHTRQLAAGDTWPGISCHVRGEGAGAEWEWDEEAGEYRRAARPDPALTLDKLREPLLAILQSINISDTASLVQSFTTKLQEFDYVDYFDSSKYPCNRRKRQASSSDTSLAISTSTPTGSISTVTAEGSLNTNNTEVSTSTTTTTTTSTSTATASVTVGTDTVNTTATTSGPSCDDAYYDDYEYYSAHCAASTASTSTVSPQELARTFYSELLETVRRLLDTLSRLLASFERGDTGKGRRRRSVSDPRKLTEEERKICRELDSLGTKLGQLKDGPIWSLAKMSVARILSPEQLQLLDEISAMDGILDTCGVTQEDVEVLEAVTRDLESFYTVKMFPDDLEDRLDITCTVPSTYDSSACTCECHKREKLMIYSLFAALKMMETFPIRRLGDVYSWYYHDQFQREPDHISTKPRSPPHIGREIINFERDLLKDLR